MAAPLLFGLYDNDNKDGEQHEHWNIMNERLLKPYLLKITLFRDVSLLE